MWPNDAPRLQKRDYSAEEDNGGVWTVAVDAGVCLRSHKCNPEKRKQPWSSSPNAAVEESANKALCVLPPLQRSSPLTA